MIFISGIFGPEIWEIKLSNAFNYFGILSEMQKESIFYSLMQLSIKTIIIVTVQVASVFIIVYMSIDTFSVIKNKSRALLQWIPIFTLITAGCNLLLMDI